MSLRIYNTLGRTKEVFSPVVPGQVTLYVCGMTTYDLCHIGHGRAMVVFDVVARYLTSLGYQVKLARNYTDIDDKIINRAHKEGEDPFKLSQRYVDSSRQDALTLGCRAPEVEPQVTTHIPQILKFVEDLVAVGKAYPASNGDVYYSVESFGEYGKLSGKKVDELIAGARVDVIEEKRAPTDFALWKAAKPGEPSWQSPWGPGRPGWHIECSAMCAEHLGETIDIHGGGSDLIFPHHENEIAQSEGLTGKPLARYWMHNAMLTVNHEKMSKSLGNFFTIRDVLKRYDPEAIRLFYVAHHYRSPVDYSDRSLEESEAGLERLYQAMRVADRGAGGGNLALLEGLSPTAEGFQKLRQLISTGVEEARSHEKALTPVEKELLEGVAGVFARIDNAMEDDFNTARVMGVLFELARAIGRHVATHPKGTANASLVLRPALLTLAGAARLFLGLLRMEPAEFQQDLNQRRLSGRGISPQEVETLLVDRAAARSRRDWAEADRIRGVFQGFGISIEDAPTGTTWRVEPASGVVALES